MRRDGICAEQMDDDAGGFRRRIRPRLCGAADGKERRRRVKNTW
jgi:hypothetical protein